MALSFKLPFKMIKLKEKEKSPILMDPSIKDNYFQAKDTEMVDFNQYLRDMKANGSKIANKEMESFKFYQQDK